jgi:hypothetical protein
VHDPLTWPSQWTVIADRGGEIGLGRVLARAARWQGICARCVQPEDQRLDIARWTGVGGLGGWPRAAFTQAMFRSPTCGPDIEYRIG